MNEITKVTLENEMDLILAHKRSMKLAELTGLSLSSQTTFATAVSEVSRSILENEKSGYLMLCVATGRLENYIVACLKNKQSANDKSKQGLEYAKRLVDKYNVYTKDAETSVELFYNIFPPFKIDIKKLDEWRMLFRNEPPISPYEELKRKNEQLVELSEKLKKSEGQYKTLTNSLPLTIFSLNKNGELLYANEWLSRFTGISTENLNENKWRSVIHEDDYDSFLLLLRSDIAANSSNLKIQVRLKDSSNEYLWHQISISPFKNENDELQHWIGYVVDIHAQKILEETLRDNIELKQAQEQLKENQATLERYIEELNRSNRELQQFAFIASHDLQEPVRKILFYCDYILETYKDTLDKKGADYLHSMHAASKRMRELIKDLLLFSQVNKNNIQFQQVNLNEVITNIWQDMELLVTEKSATLNVQDLPTIPGDAGMMHQLFSNIIKNALKFSRENTNSSIEIGYREVDDAYEISLRDNGIGFDNRYLPQMFTLFQRLHARKDFEGTGLGLAICKKIVEIHNGDITADSTEDEGSVFYVTLPKKIANLQ